MPGYNGSGVYQRFRSWEGDAAAGVKIRADFHDTEDNGFAAGLSNVICRDGQSTVVANIPFNAKKITNLAAGTDPTDAINLGQLTAFRTFPTGIVISGSGANGMVNFTGATMPVGLSFTANDTAWVARTSGTPANYLNRLALNDKADGSGSDVLFIDEHGRVNSQGGGFMANITYNGGSWHVIDAGFGGVLNIAPATGSFNYFTHPTAAAAGGAVPIAPVFFVDKDGNVNANGRINAGDTIRSNNTIQAGNQVQSDVGSFCGQNGNGQILLTPSMTNVNGTMFFRPNGHNNVAGQCILSTDGTFQSSGILDGNGVKAGTGLATRSGSTGGYDGHWFNAHWNGVGLHGYVDATYLGQFTFASDYRIKKDVEDLPSTWEQVKALRPIKYTQAEFQPPMSDESKAVMLQRAIEQYALENGIEVDEVDPQDIPEAKPAAEPLFPADDIERWGFIAHELQETLIDSAATGVKDMEDGVQSPNPWTILAAITKAMQEAMTRIEALEAA